MIRHLLVTNDFPPKVGGIQSYLWELWRRLPPEDFTVLTSPYRGADRFDEDQPFRIVRTPQPWLLPSPLMASRIRRLAAETGAKAVVLDPAVPLGLVGPKLGISYAAVLHGAEVTIPGRLPGSRRLLATVLREASLLVSAGGYPEAEARRAEPMLPPVVQVPPGVDVSRFEPLGQEAVAASRAELGLPVSGPLVVCVSRLVPRKGIDVLIEAAHLLARGGRHADLTVAVAGAGRDRARLERLVARTGAPVRLLGRVADEDLARLYGCADAFAMICRARWAGLEQEGFGIVFLEAGACGVPSVAGQSGGAAEAVIDGETGTVVGDPRDPVEVAAALAALLDDPASAATKGRMARARAESEFGYDLLSARLREALDTAFG